MATAATAQVGTEQRAGAASLATNSKAFYTRVVTFPMPVGADSGDAVNVTGIKFPANTVILAHTAKFSVAQGTSQLVFSLATAGAIGTKMAQNHTNVAARTQTQAVVTTVEDQLKFQISDGAVPAGAGQTCEATFLCCTIGQDPAKYPPAGN